MALSRIIITGFPQSGKTQLGKRLARARDCRWLDLDHMMLNNYNTGRQTQVKTCRQIWDAEGADFFRRLERDTLAAFLGRQSSEPFVLSLGGGAAVDSINREVLLQLKKVPGVLIVALSGSPDAIFARMQRKGFTRVIDPDRPRESFQELYESRQVVYAQVAHFVFETDGDNLEEVAANLAARVREFENES